MSEEILVFQGEFDRFFQFESYGVRVRIESNFQDHLDQAEGMIRKAMLDRIEIIENPDIIADHTFGFGVDESGLYFFVQNGKPTGRASREIVFGYFETMLRITIAEHAVSTVFIHAGVVALDGKAILIPAHSSKGKTTLVAELVKNGAVYYSDEYAVLDKRGFVHAFPRPLAMRGIKDEYDHTEVSVESLGGTAGIEPLPVGMILITEYKPDAVWNPEFLTVGQGLLDVIPHTIPIGYNTEFALEVLKKMASHAIIARSPRNDAKLFANTLLSFFDKNINCAKIT